MAEPAPQPAWRQGFDVLERQVGPALESVVRSEQFAVAVGLAARVQRSMQDQASRATRRVLHQLNLPAGTDVSRILNEIGRLQRQVRELNDQLDETRAALEATKSGKEKPRGNRTGTQRARRPRSS